MWYRNGPFWCTVVVLVVALGHLYLLPSWWRGSWHASKVRWRDRAWLVIVLAVVTTCLATIIIHILDSEGRQDMWWLWVLGSLLYPLSALLVCLIPLVGWWRRFDFAVPPVLRTPTDTPENWAEPKTLIHGNRQQRRAKRYGR